MYNLFAKLYAANVFRAYLCFTRLYGPYIYLIDKKKESNYQQRQYKENAQSISTALVPTGTQMVPSSTLMTKLNPTSASVIKLKLVI